MNWVAIALSTAISLASSSVVVAIVTAFTQRKQVDASADKTKVNGAAILSDTALEQLQSMRETLKAARTALEAWKVWGHKMVITARQNGIEFDDPPDVWF